MGLAVLLACSACARGREQTRDEEFHTSGSREADQRAEQRVSKAEQIRDEGEGSSKKKEEERRTLYARLGGEEGIQRIVSDFVSRALADPRANWERKGVKRGGVLGFGRSSAEWKPTPERIEALELHIAQFVSVASGGPAVYEGKEMSRVHAGMKITNAEFDASIGALKATLDALAIATEEQKELLAIFESTRPQIVEKR